MRAFLPLFSLLLLAACGGASDPVTVPDGWVRDGAYFWKADVDTTGLFRDLETLDAMGLAGEAGNDDRRAFVERNLKRNLLVLYRHQPEIVDSLFEEIAMPLIDGADLGGSLNEAVANLEKPAGQAIGQRFKQPIPMRDVKTETSYVFPDSLQKTIGAARVRLQVALDAQGDPLAIEVLEPVNPTLDLIAVRTATEQHWQRIYLYRDREWIGIPGWVRYNVVFGDPREIVAPEAETPAEAS